MLATITTLVSPHLAEPFTYDYLAACNPKLLGELRGMLDRYAGRLGRRSSARNSSVGFGT